MDDFAGMSGNSSPASSFSFGDSGLGSSGDYQRPHGHGVGDWSFRSSSPAGTSAMMLHAPHRSNSGSFIPNFDPRLHNLEKENASLRAENGALKYVLRWHSEHD